MDKINPDLTRIGINWSPAKDQNLAQNPTPDGSPDATTKIVDTPKTEVTVASSDLDLDDENSDDPEADNPKYIE